MARTGMFVAPLAGSPPQGMAPTDGRLVLGGIFQVASQLVAGGGYTPSASVMQMTVNQAVWSLTDPTNASAVFFTPTDQVTLTFGAAPGTGGRIDLVVVKQNNVENGDADSRVNVTVVAGVASGSPVAPAVPAGASKYLQVLINAGVTNIAAATITNSMQSLYADPQLQAPTWAALQTVTGVASQIAIVTADASVWKNGTYLWVSGAWAQQSTAGKITFTPSWTNLVPGSGTVTAWYQISNGILTGAVNVTFGSGYAVGTSPKFTLPVPIASGNATGTSVGTGLLIRSGSAYYSGQLINDSSGSVVVMSVGAGAALNSVQFNSPATWQIGDNFSFQFSYPV